MRLFVSLSLSSLDRLAIQKEINSIGRSYPTLKIPLPFRISQRLISPLALAKRWRLLYTVHGRWGMNRQIEALLAMSVFLATQGQAPAPPEVPESLKAPAGEEVILVAYAKGTQIYVCQQGSDKKYAWVFKAPEAELLDATGKKIIQHSAGPTWRHMDGSEVKAKGGAR